MKTTGAILGYSMPSCKGFADQQSACSYAETITREKRTIRYIILTGYVYFVSDTADVQPYEKLLFIFDRGEQIEKDPKKPIDHKHIGERSYSNKFKTAENNL